MCERYYLNKEWELKLGDNYSSSTPTKIKKIKSIKAEVPGTVHTDLLKNKLIDEPFYSNNEIKLSWISESDWVYKTVFDSPFELEDTLPIKLIFEGIDTVAKIYFNGIHIDKTRNMFLKYEFDVTKLLKLKNNELELFFESPINFSINEEQKYGKLPVARNSNRVYIRKAQYSFGWDWGPSFPTMGIWRNVYLEKETKALISNLRFNTIEVKDGSAIVEILFDVKKNTNEIFNVKMSMSYEDSLFEKSVRVSGGINCVRLGINNPALWMPNGYGEQNLYNLEIHLCDELDNIVDSIKKKTGIRKIELQLKENGENTFRFIVNGKKIFAKGVNWIPGDAFLTRVKEDKYRKLLSLAKEANVNFVRVWGGGIYENDIFYELCDELGLLVWQDFMFACGAYPEHEEFIQNIKEELLYNINRLQYHSSIAIWCGNNENEWIWVREQKSSYEIMPGYKIYHEIIPSILHELDPIRPYWQSSPFGFDNDPNSQNSGNRHQWDIWSKWNDYSKVINDNSLFVTEFGFQGPANKSTLEKYIPKRDIKIQSEVFEFHNKQIEGSERVLRFLSAHFPISTKWDEYIYLAQLNQSLAKKTCIEHWRFNQPATNGSIIWQINDTWPVTSWSLIDSEMKPKMSYYFVKRSFAPLIIRFKENKKEIEILGLNQTVNDFEGVLEFLVIDSISGIILNRKRFSIVLPSESLHSIDLISKDFASTEILIATLYDKKKNQIHRDFFHLKEWKYLKLPKAKIKVKLIKKGKRQLAEVTTDKPAFFVDVISSKANFSDRGMIILPGEKVLLNIQCDKNKTIKKSEIEIYSLN